MKKITLSLFCVLAVIGVASAQLVISEIMYNPPESSTDSLEFIEIHNPSTSAINVEDYVLGFSTAKDTLTGSIPAGGFYVSAVNARAFETIYGVAPSGMWLATGLSNSGTTITLSDASGAEVASVSYDDASPWPTEPDGNGPSLELCNIASPDNGASWQASTTATGANVDGTPLLASPFSLPTCAGGPGPASYELRTIGEMITVDATGTLDSINATATLEGTVNTIDFNGGAGLEFYIQDATGGIRIMSSQDLYTVSLGDVVSIRGTLEQRNGSAQFSTDSIRMLPTTMMLTPKVVTSITEADQGQLVMLEDVSLVNADDWSTSGSFNVDVTDGTTVTTVRIDSDTDFAGMNEPTGTFDIIGVANQYDTSSPYDEGYQIQPRFVADVSPYNAGSGPSFPLRAIDDINNVDATTGVADSLGKKLTTVGTVIGFNVNSGGVQFTLVDADGNGIGVYNQSDDLGYTVTEGDQITVVGEVDQYNGLTQIEAEEITFVSSQNSIPASASVATLDEFSESRLVTLDGLTIVDPNEWLADPSASYNVRFSTSSLDTFLVRIDDGSSVGDLQAPPAGVEVSIRGIGGQFDRDAPFFDGYQLFPRTQDDIGVSLSINTVDPAELFSVLPQGGGWQLEIKQALTRVELHEMNGRLVKQLTNLQPGTIYLSKQVAGSYVLTATTADRKSGSLILAR